MPESSKYLKTAEKFASLLERGKIFPHEYAVNVVVQACQYDVLDREIAKQIAASVPATGLDAIIAELRKVTSAGYQESKRAIGGPGPGEAKLIEMQLTDARRIQAWGSALAEFLRERVKSEE